MWDWDWMERSDWPTRTTRRFTNHLLVYFNGSSRLVALTSQLQWWRCPISTPCLDKVIWIASKESMGIFPRCTMLQSKSWPTHLLTQQSQSRCTVWLGALLLHCHRRGNASWFPKAKREVGSYSLCSLMPTSTTTWSVMKHSLAFSTCSTWLPLTGCSSGNLLLKWLHLVQSARTCTEPIIDLRLTLQHLGASINRRSMPFSDNKSVINSAVILHLKMHKHCVAMSYHRVRWIVAAGLIHVYHIAGKRTQQMLWVNIGT